jgi:hypothetical protein
MRLRRPSPGLVIASLAISLGVIVNELALSPNGAEFRAWLKGYDGCVCMDCTAAQRIGPSTWQASCRPPFAKLEHDRTVGVAMSTSFAALALAFVAFDRRPNPNRCPTCRYDTTGLRDPTCPECGTYITPPTRAQPSK